VHPDPTATISGTSAICEGASAPISILFTGTPPWRATYTDGTNPVTINTGVSPYTFTVSPTITSTWSITSANDAFCDVPADSIHGLAYISVNPLP
ncbi:MAG: hypothetical protein JZU63_07290, partial [Rhodoferax sp.]|nr:hypothetical protein [Rhodoferax sp.]